MPWKETCAMDERSAFIKEWQSGVLNFSALCGKYRISRKTGYKWRRRYRRFGESGLVDQSRAAQHQPRALKEETIRALIALKQRYPSFGPKKLRVLFKQHHPEGPRLAASTIGDVLTKQGLTKRRVRRQRSSRYTNDFVGYYGPNAVWCADFKGPLVGVAGDKAAQQPLTITDGYSRYVLRCEALTQMRTRPVKQAFEAAFREFGVPDVIRTDNGPPFASVGLAGLSELSVWWVKLGIVPERIRPGKPADNGRHERMHRTLKEALSGVKTKTPQAAYDRFRWFFNQERPHEAIAMKTPASVYHPSPKRYPRILKDPSYPKADVTERLDAQGRLYFKGRTLPLTPLLAGQLIGIHFAQMHEAKLFFGPIFLGTLNHFRFKPPHKKRMLPKSQSFGDLKCVTHPSG